MLAWLGFMQENFPSSILFYTGCQHSAYPVPLHKLFSLIRTPTYLPLKPIVSVSTRKFTPYITYTGSTYTYIMNRYPEIACVS